jgi:general stress protein YciG
MSGTKAGGQKAAAKNLAKDPNFYSRIGSEGGKNGTTGGFGNGEEGRELARRAGKIGGTVSRRGKSVVQIVEVPKPSLWQGLKTLLGQTHNG